MYQIRKCKQFTSYQGGEVANLVPDKFRNLSIPYVGNTQEDFFDYITQNSWDLQDIYQEFDEQTLLEMEKIWQPNWEEFDNSENKFEDSWMEMGHVNSEWSRRGGFESFLDTLN